MHQLKTDLSKFDNAWYKPGNKIRWMLWIFTSAVFFTNPVFVFMRPKSFLLRLFGARVGKGLVIKPKVTVKFPWLLAIGNHVWIGENVWIDNLAKVEIGNNCCISQGAMLLCGNHNYKKQTFDLMAQPITLEEGVWIGAKSVVCPGVTCKSHAILSVNSVASSDLESFSIYQGNPGVKIRERIIES